jgi:DNA invertase Pin-like site-specific DNA recombinase
MKVKEIKATKPSRSVKGTNVERQRVAAYCRVSTDDEEQLNSYLSQKKYYTDLIQKKKEWQFAGIYADAAITGTQVTKRADFLRLINDCLNNEIDMVITKSISRFARNTYDTLKYVRMLKEKGVSIFFEEENIDTMTMDGELMLTILSSVAQQEVENISENVKKGLKMKMKRGEIVGFQGCIGYDYDKSTKTLSVNETEAEIVRNIFEMYTNGFGATLICKELNDKGHKTKKGNKWSNSTLIGIIKNEKYVGDLMMGKTFTTDPISKRRLDNHGEEDKYYIKDHHEAIISRDTFDKAQEILSKRSYDRKPKGTNATREKYSRKYAFSSILECGYCGSNFSRRAWHSSSPYRKIIWQCITNSKKGKEHCEHSKGIPEEIIELAFLESYTMLCGRDRELVDGFIKRIETNLGGKTVTKKLDKFERDLSEITNKKKKLLNLLLEDGLDKNLFDCSMLELEEKEVKTKHNISDLEIQLEHEKELNKRIDTFKKALSGDYKLEKFDRHIFESLIEKVIIGGTDDDENIDPYKITFIYKTGLDNSIDGTKYRKDGRKKTKNVLPLNSSDEVEVLPTNSSHDTCGRGFEHGEKKNNK